MKNFASALGDVCFKCAEQFYSMTNAAHFLRKDDEARKNIIPPLRSFAYNVVLALVNIIMGSNLEYKVYGRTDSSCPQIKSFF